MDTKKLIQLIEGLARGTYGSKRKLSTHPHVYSKVPVKRKGAWQNGNQRRSKQSYVAEDDFAGGTTDTGKQADTITTKVVSKIENKKDKMIADKINTIKENKRK